jgi:flagellar protein FliO/FliZ
VTASWWSLLWLVFIVCLIPLSLWVLKRSGYAGGLARPAMGGMRLVGSLPIGPQQRIVTVEVGEGAARRWLMLGVTAQQIQLLHQMAPGAAVEAPGAPPAQAAFAQMLARFAPLASPAAGSRHER